VLFVGTRDGQDRAVVKASQMAKGYHLFERWIPGSITNGQQILGKCRTKVVNEKDEEISGFDEQLYDRPVLRPDLVVCLNPLENYVLLHECALNNIPTIGVIDTNADPTWVTYPIPANDDRYAHYILCINQANVTTVSAASKSSLASSVEPVKQAKSNASPPQKRAKSLTVPQRVSSCLRTPKKPCRQRWCASWRKA
jgi:ribosomal protein S2